MCIWEWAVSCFNRFEQYRFYTNEDSCTSYIRHAFCWGYNFYNYFWTALYLQTCILIWWGCLWVNLSQKGNLTRYALASCAEAKMRKLLMYWHIHNKIFQPSRIFFICIVISMYGTSMSHRHSILVAPGGCVIWHYDFCATPPYLDLWYQKWWRGKH